MLALDALLTRAARHKDLARRSRQLSRVDRALADPELGYMRRLRELRSSTLRERRDAGVPVTLLAQESGVGVRRIWALLAEEPNTRYESTEMKDAKAAVKAEQAARAAAAKARREAERAASLAQGAVWAARVLSGEAVRGLAEQEHVPWQVVANRIKAANIASSAAA